MDNLGSGGIVASIDVDNGIINSLAYSKNGDSFEVHPVTNVSFLGYEIPFWNEVVNLCKRAALLIPEVRCVGWDVAITPNKPIIIEGNDRWCRFVWQLPVQKGLYSLIK